MQHQGMEELLPLPGLIFQGPAQQELPRQGEVPVHTDREQQPEDPLALMQLQETEHTEQVKVQDQFRGIHAVRAAAIHTGDILQETAHIAGALQQTDRARQAGLMEAPLNGVPDIPGLHPLCQEHRDIVPEEVRDQEVQVTEVQEVAPEEVRAIEVLDPAVQVEVRVIEVLVVA